MFKKILIGIGALFLLLVVVGVAGGGGDDTSSADESISGTNEDTTEPAPAEASDTKEPAKEEPAAEEPAAEEKPAGNTVGNWAILNKPKFGQEYGMFKSVDLRVQNISDSEDEPWLEIRLTNGNDLVTTFDCIGQTVRPGETTTLQCSSLDDYRPFTDYEIQNAF